MPPVAAIASFAELHKLAFSESAELPEQGDLLCRGGTVEGAATGALPGGIEGTLAHFTYTYTWTDSDNHTHHEERPFTIVVTRVPESIGFMPYLGFSGAGSKLNGLAGGLEQMQKVDLEGHNGLKGASAYAYKGASENWTMQLFSPALIDWLARSDDEFGFELAAGVLCVAHDTYLNLPEKLETLCSDAAYIAGLIREESLEETTTGGAEAEAAKDPKLDDAKMEMALAAVDSGTPDSVGAATRQFAAYLRTAPVTIAGALGVAIGLTLILNVPGAAIPIILTVEGAYGLLAAIEGALLLIIFFFAFRSRVRKNSQKYAAEAFFRAYAKQRELTIEEPLHFAATHAEAKLPFKPDRVFTGMLPGGVNGSLILVGDGSKRADRIAVVAGPRGPLAESELQAEPQGLSAKDLDTYLEQLAGEAKDAPAAAGQRA
ncbi:MAG TPA: hypothetical protein VG518_09870 [Solirubrobacterales bacterium]|nr:hypothetical protein [Solirubrobacterales bacterium]